MNDVYILCVDDDPADLEQVRIDIAEFEGTFPIRMTESAEQARKILKEIKEEGSLVGLIICAHILPEESGIDLLVSLNHDLGMLDTRKLLITRNAGLAETIKGLNEGRLNYYLPKPWESEQLTNAVKEQLTEFFIRIRKNPMAFIDKLNSMRILEAIHKGLIPIEST